MPYLDPAQILKQFSQFLQMEVRPAIPDDERTTRAQVGSMSSTLRFLSKELAGREEAFEHQRQALLEALDEIDRRLTNLSGADRVQSEVIDARAQLKQAEGTFQEREAVVLDSSDAILAAIEGDLEDDEARSVRKPMYDFLETWVDSQLRMLGGESTDE